MVLERSALTKKVRVVAKAYILQEGTFCREWVSTVIYLARVVGSTWGGAGYLSHSFKTLSPEFQYLSIYAVEKLTNPQALDRGLPIRV